MSETQNTIPKGWKKYLLADVLLFLRNGTSSSQVSYKTIYPVTRIETISTGSVDHEKVGYVENLDKSYKIEKGDLLLSNINSLKHIGKVVYFDSDKDLYHGMNLLLLRFNDLMDKKFGYYLLKLKKQWLEEHASKAVNQASINQTTLNKLPLIAPKNILEQKKIAEILSAVDLEIEKTNKIIFQTEKLKKGLSQKFFDNKNYKSESIYKISEVLTGGTPKTSNKSYWGGDIKWMSSGEVNIKRIKDTEKKITKEGLDNSNARILPIGAVMVALAGQGKTRGKVAILETETTCNQSLAAIVVDKKYLLDEFLYYNLDYRYKELRNINGEGRAGLNLTIIKNIKIPVPKIEEQKYIVNQLTSLDERINFNMRYKETLEMLKKGLMHDLLSGKVRAI
jgi:type I restriction enzyme, S subunit